VIRLQLAGRLGNHLFQWATALSLQSNDRPVKLTYDEFHQSTPSPLLYELVNGQISIDKSNLTGRILQVEDKYFYHSSHLKAFIYTESDPFSIYKEIPKSVRIVRGFFQNWKNFSNVDSEVTRQLNTTLNNWRESHPDVKRFISEVGVFHAVHVRQGDYSSTNFGTLSPEYYERNKHQTSLPVVVFADHENLGEEYKKAIQPDFIVTPKTLSAEDSFALMSQAHSITLANSTFSWWSGFLIARREGEVVIPEPWLKNGPTGTSLIYPGMQKSASKFN
jgi:hypothetical protein